MADEFDQTLYEVSLYDTDGNFLQRFPCVPPFDTAPEIMISGTRYFILMDDLTYHEASDVHWLPEIPVPPAAVPGPEPEPG